MRYALTNFLGVSYVILVVTLGFVLHVEAAFSVEEHDHSDPVYVLAFDTYLFGLAMIGLLYMICYANRKGQEGGSDNEPSQVTINFVGRRPSHVIKAEDSVQCENPRAKETDGISTCPSSPDELPVDYQTSGVSLLLRIGAIGFGTCSVIYDILTGLRYNKVTPKDQQSGFYYFVVILHTIFTFSQTYFIYKLHQIVFNRHKFLVRVCLVHLIACNICIWFGATIKEIRSGFDQDSSLISPTTSSPATHDTINPQPHNDTTNNNVSETGATVHDEPTFVFIDYLFPCIVEYSLIAVGIIYHVYQNVGRVQATASAETNEEEGNQAKSSVAVDCTKSTSGLFGGLFVLVASIVAIICYLTNQITDNLMGESVICIDILPNVILLVVVTALFIKFRKLRFVHVDSQEVLDVYLLITSLVGVAALQIFHMYVAFDYIVQYGHEIDMAILSVVRSAIEVFETIFQTVFIVLSSRRQCRTIDEAANKPGRSLLMLAMVVNFSMWLLGVFFIVYNETFFSTGLLLESDEVTTIRAILFTRICLPLNMFIRFQSTVCFYEIWNSAYEVE